MPRYKIDVPPVIIAGMRAWNLLREVSLEFYLKLADTFENWSTEPPEGEFIYTLHVNYSDSECYEFRLRLTFSDDTFHLVQCNCTEFVDGVIIRPLPLDDD